MGDTISRQAAINTLIRESQVDGAYGYLDTKSIVDALKRMPSADVAEVVRCKDCIYHEPGTEELDAWCNVWGNTTICDGYCFYGEQKSEG